MQEELYLKKTKKIEHFLTTLALAPLSPLEQRERKRKLKQRLDRLEYKQKTILNYTEP
jgi:hypothetical protein